jgi:hypothetical protein
MTVDNYYVAHSRSPRRPARILPLDFFYKIVVYDYRQNKPLHNNISTVNLEEKEEIWKINW